MKQKELGIAAIPLIIGLLVMATATTLGIKLVQDNQNLQNRAAHDSACLNTGQKGCFTSPCCSGLICSQNICKPGVVPTKSLVNCQEITKLLKLYCPPGTDPDSPPADTVPCVEIEKTFKKYCPRPSPPPATSISPRPSSKPSSSPVPSIRPTAFATDTAHLTPTITSCTPDSLRCIGPAAFTCLDGQWKFQELCQSGCQNGNCLD